MEIGMKNTKKKKRGSIWQVIVRQRCLLIMVVPFIIWYVVFCYLPMIGLIGAFEDYQPALGYLKSEWVGIKYFKQFITGYHFPIIMRNTLVLSFLKLAIGFPVPILFALLLNEIRLSKFKKVVQTVSYLPQFISWVVIISLFGRMLSTDGGLLNNFLLAIGAIDKPIAFMSDPSYVWPIAVLTEIWKGMGWGSIIYLAAITGVNEELYEAADIDGASRGKKILHITIPCIRPTIAIQLILSAGGLMSGNMEQMWLLGVPTNMDKAEIIDTYVVRMGLQNTQFGLATAIGLMTSLVSVILVVTTDRIVKKLGEEGLF